MKTLTLRWFTKTEALVPIGRYLLDAFFNRFREALARFGIEPPSPQSQTPHYYFQAATWLKSKQPWPDSFEKALFEIEELAASGARDETRTDRGFPSRSTSENIDDARAADACLSSEALRLAESRSQPAADGSAYLREAVLLWLKNHPTDDAREVERAIEADRLRVEQDKSREAELLKKAERQEDEWQTQSHPPNPSPAPLPIIHHPSSTIHQPIPAPHQPSTTNHQPTCILPSVKIDSDTKMADYFMPHQIAWIYGEEELHAQKKPVFALAEKSVRIGWTFCDAFKNVRKRLCFPNRDYLFATRDYPSAREYMTQAREFAELLNFTRAIVAHGEDYLKVHRLDPEGRPTAFTEEIKISYIKFDNKSRILAFSAHPQAMAVYGGDVGLDEFAKHPNAQLLWQTAQGRVTWGYDLAVWSAHEGEDTLFNQFVQQARAGKPPWNLYYRVTIQDAIRLGLLDVINRTRGTALTEEQFIGDCKARAGLEEIFQQTYLCNPVPGGAGIVDWSAIERCRSDYAIERVHLEADEVLQRFGETSPARERARENEIHQFLRQRFAKLIELAASSTKPSTHFRLGFDVAASGSGNLAAFYIDEVKSNQLWLKALLTLRTEDWHFLKTVLCFFLNDLRNVQGAGDASGLGQQICWEAAKKHSGRFLAVNFASKKQDLGFALMNQLSAAEKCFPRGEPDIAADYFALRKTFIGSKWVFSEGRNTHNPASHCDIAWAGALASHAHTERRGGPVATVILENGQIVSSDDPPEKRSATARMILSNDPRIWRPLNY